MALRSPLRNALWHAACHKESATAGGHATRPRYDSQKRARETDVTRTAEHVQRQEVGTTEDRMNEILDDVLGRFSEVGIQRLLELAGHMVEARIADGPNAHVEVGQGERN